MAKNSSSVPADLVELAELSNYYGKKPEYVLAGGGNTSVKIADTLYIKGSGTELAKITAEQFVPLRRDAVAATLLKTYSVNPMLREDEIKKDLLAARVGGNTGRPSVETTLHNMFQARFVVHLHPNLVNTLTCGQDGQKIVANLLGDSAVWLPYTDPGFTLAQAVEKKLIAYREAHGGKDPEYLIIQNHGPFIPADSPAHARRKITSLFSKLRAFHAKSPVKTLGGQPVSASDERENLLRLIGPALRAVLAEGDAFKTVVFDDSPLVLEFVATAVGRKCLAAGPLTPDQIVYCKSFPLWIPYRRGESPELVIHRLTAGVHTFRMKRGYDPKVVAVEDLGLFAVGDSAKAAQTVRDVYVDALKIMKGAFAAGGPHFLTPRQYGFIDEWEVEQYRRKVSAAEGAAGRLRNKVAAVIGAGGQAGDNIAEGLSREGAGVALLDPDQEKIRKTADAILALRGPGAALALRADSTKIASLMRASTQIAQDFGGVDLLIHVISAPKSKGKAAVDAVANTALREFALVYKAFAPLMVAVDGRSAKPHGDVIQVIRESNGSCVLCRLTIDQAGVGTAAGSVSVFPNIRNPKEVPDLTNAILSLLQPKGGKR